MKRSEMVDVLFNSMNKHFTYYGDEGWSADYDAILLDLEKAGMLPPENGKEASYILDYRFKCLKWDEE